MSCYLIILYRKHYVFYRTLYNCTNQIHQAPQHIYFISCFFNSNETCMWCTFRFIFKFLLLRLFFKLWLSHLLNMQKQSKKLWKSREWRDKEKIYIYIFNSKKEFVRIHSFMRSTKSLKFDPPPHFSPLCINIQFWSKRIPLLDVLNLHSNHASV